MTRFGICASGLVVILASVVSAGLPPEVVKDLDVFVGDWATVVEIDGKTYRGEWVAEWSSDRTCLETYWKGTGRNGPARGSRVHGWDAANKKMLVVDFGTDGSSSIERYAIAKKGISDGTIAGIDSEGKQYAATARTEWKDSDSFTWTVTRDGVALVHHFRRVNQVTKPIHMPPEARKALDYFVGTWDVKSTQGDKPWGEATWKTQWAKGKPCLHCTQTWKDENGVDLGAGMWGYDIAGKQLVYTQYYVTGSNATIKLKLPKESIKPGTKLRGKIDAVLDDGTVFSAEATMELKSPDHYVYSASGRVAADGEELPAAEVHFRKQ